jgi:hypothetical protein
MRDNLPLVDHEVLPVVKAGSACVCGYAFARGEAGGGGDGGGCRISLLCAVLCLDRKLRTMSTTK